MTSAPVILITGGSRGIGAATASLAAERGYDVCISYCENESAANSVCRDVESNGRRALAIRADFAHSSDIDDLWNQALQEFPQVGVLVNNVGILDRQMTFADLDRERIQRVFRVNVFGTFHCTQHAVRHMSTDFDGSGGAIINISSVAARLGAASEYVDYAASKAAIDTMTIGLAKEVAEHGIRVNAIRPGSCNTEIHALGGEPDRVNRVAQRIPMKRGGDPREVAEAVMWLASAEASYITGSILDVTGGI